MTHRTPRLFTGLLALAGAWALLSVVRLVAFGGDSFGLLWERGSMNVVCFVVAASCLARVVRLGAGHERTAWLLIGLGIATWTLGDVYFAVELWDADTVPIPSPADIGYLGAVPLLLIGGMFLLRARASRVAPMQWADAAVGALTVAAISAAIVFGAVRDAAEGSALEVATSLTYPLADLLLISLAVGALGSRAWHIDRSWAMLAGGLLVFMFADSQYLVENAPRDLRAHGVV